MHNRFFHSMSVNKSSVLLFLVAYAFALRIVHIDAFAATKVLHLHQSRRRGVNLHQMKARRRNVVQLPGKNVSLSGNETRQVGDIPSKASLAMMDVINVEADLIDTEIGKGSASMKEESKESISGETQSILTSVLLLGVVTVIWGTQHSMVNMF